MENLIEHRIQAAQTELHAALEAHLTLPAQGGSVRGRADSQARIDAASTEIERLTRARRLLGGPSGATAAPPPAPAAGRAAPVPKELEDMEL
ncbi:MAG: hypothetical protein OJI67_10080, partial [Prosthecobacter sp.]|nr:hypothetical protein [Prosthecobacter sp.]